MTNPIKTRNTSLGLKSKTSPSVEPKLTFADAVIIPMTIKGRRMYDLLKKNIAANKPTRHPIEAQ